MWKFGVIQEELPDIRTFSLKKNNRKREQERAQMEGAFFYGIVDVAKIDIVFILST